MKLSGVKTFSSIFLVLLGLIFSYQHLILAQGNDFLLPQNLNELLAGKKTDLSSVAAEIGENDLPAALAIVELLKFKAPHREIPANIDQINSFEAKVKLRLEKSSVVSFTKTDSCRKKIEKKEIEFTGQKLVIPEFYIADIGLAITGVIPNSETGTMFPVIQIDVFFTD